MDTADSFRRLNENLDPSPGAKERVKARMSARIAEPALFSQVRQTLNPTPQTVADVWLQVRRSMGIQPAIGLLGRLKKMLEPDAATRFLLRERILQRLEPRSVSVTDGLWKWSAAFVAVALVVRMGPTLLTNTSLTPRTSASAEVLVTPTFGEVSFLQNDDFWQPLDGVDAGVTLTQAGTIRTDDGQATITLPNYGVIRMDKNTILAVEDVSTGLEPAPGTTVKLMAGRIWVQGLLPSYLRGIRIAALDSIVEVHEGSVSVAIGVEGKHVDVDVSNRSATITRGEESSVIVTGESVHVRPGMPFTMKDVDLTVVDAWKEQNLARDAVRRKEVAQMQLERRVANAGILPTSPLFVLKQAAEAMDSALTWDEQARLEKQLAYADNRLNEAAALLSEGESDAADTALEEYKRTLLAVASSSGSDLVRSLLHQEVAASTADVSAALPDDNTYVLKETVLQASAELPDGFVDARRVEGVLLLDTLSALNKAVTDGDLATASVTFAELEPYLTALKAEQRSLPPDVRKDAMASLSVIAGDLVALAGEGDVPEDLLAQVEPFAPEPEPEKPLMYSIDEAQHEAMKIIADLERFTTVRALENTIRAAVRSLRAEPRQNDELVLRTLYAILERGEGNLNEEQRGRVKEEVREALRALREAQ